MLDWVVHEEGGDSDIYGDPWPPAPIVARLPQTNLEKPTSVE